MAKIPSKRELRAKMWAAMSTTLWMDANDNGSEYLEPPDGLTDAQNTAHYARMRAVAAELCDQMMRRAEANGYKE